ncbi:helix-turn-helix transcriptional regulator [Desertimonas flava]|uniref:helix-turn-helix transcriptional regulator n=1 Tax=Desertimonas flava TaxID=2064846 RepID=UPI0013C46A75|nr:WYL domain-containing protein [Desertimonas flava]
MTAPRERRGPASAEQRLRRLLVMLPWLMERREVPLAEVARTFKMPPEEVATELELAAMCGVPPFVDEMIDVFIDDEMVYVGVPRLFTKPLRLTAPEGFALLTSGRAAMQLPGADPGSPLGRGLAKLAAVLGEPEDGAALVVELAPTPLVDEFVEATRRVERLRMRYFTASRDEVTEREFTPRRVFHERGDWFVAGDDHLSGEYRTFRVDRVEAIEHTGEVDDPIDADAADHPATSVSWSADGSLPRVTIRLQPAARWAVEQYPVVSVVDAGDGAVDATFVVLSEVWLERLLLRVGTGAEVLEPAKWRSVAREAATRLLAKYQ